MTQKEGVRVETDCEERNAYTTTAADVLYALHKYSILKYFKFWEFALLAYFINKIDFDFLNIEGHSKRLAGTVLNVAPG